MPQYHWLRLYKAALLGMVGIKCIVLTGVVIYVTEHPLQALRLARVLLHQQVKGLD